MSKKLIDAWRRADGAIAGAVLLMMGTAIAHAALNPYTDSIPGMRVEAPAVAQSARAPEVVAAKPAPSEVAMAQLLAERRCLAEVMYWEARGEGVRGQMAVAEVVFHRMRSGAYPASICGVVFEGAQLKHSCQFSFVCNGEIDHRKDPSAWRETQFLAAGIMTGAIPLGDMTDDATSYHAVSVDPSWAGQMVKTVQIGNHVFYREPSSRAM
jgi:spore germination cell wall hydrolase CwlJ-like protein